MGIIAKVVNVGTGAGLVFRDENAQNQINLKTIKAGSNITVTNNADDITLAADDGNKVFEQLLGYYWYMSYAAYNIANPAADLQGKNMVTGGQPSDLIRLHEDYDGADIKMMISGYYFSPGTTANNTINVKSRWQSIGDDLDVAFAGGGVNLTLTKPNTGGYRVFKSNLVTLTPEGAWGANKVLFVRFKRTDEDGDTPIVTHVKISYEVS